VIEEIDRIVKKEIPTAQEIQDMEYTKRVLTEVLRLHPSVPLDGREAAEDDILPSGHPVHKGISQSVAFEFLTGVIQELQCFILRMSRADCRSSLKIR